MGPCVSTLTNCGAAVEPLVENFYTNVDQKREKGTSVATPKKHDKKLHTIKGARRGITVPRMLLSCYDSCDGGQRDTVERTSKANMAPFKMQFVGSKHVQY